MRSLLLAVFLPAIASAQLANVPAGARVRVFAPEMPQWTNATLVARPGDSITVRLASGSTRTIARPQLFRMDVSRGGSRWKGAKRGALIGAAVGAGLPLLASLGGSSGNEGAAGPAVVVVVVGGGLLGLVPGALVGSLFPAEHWERVVP